MARGGNPNSSWAAHEDIPSWVQTALGAAQLEARENAAKEHAQELAEQRHLYGRIIDRPKMTSSCTGTAVQLEALVSRAIETDQYEIAAQIYAGWAIAYDLMEPPALPSSFENLPSQITDPGTWMIACSLSHSTRQSKLQSMLALQRTREIARSDSAHLLEKRWLPMMGTESLWGLLAQAELESEDQILPQSGLVRVSCPHSRSDRSLLRDIHDSYTVRVIGGYLNTTHNFGKCDHATLLMKEGQLTDIRPGGLAGPTAVSWAEGAAMNVARARDLFDPTTVVQLHEEARH